LLTPQLSPSNYESQTAKQKQEFIWQKALADNGVPSKFAGTLEQSSLILPVL